MFAEIDCKSEGLFMEGKGEDVRAKKQWR